MVRRGLPVLGVVGALLAGSPAQPLTFSFTCIGDPSCSGFSASALAGFQAAGQRWSSLLADPMEVALAIGFRNLGGSTLGGADPTFGRVDYASYRALFTADRTSAADVTADGSLQSGPAFNLLINGTSDSPTGLESSVPYVDADGGLNNQAVLLTYANAKALGFAVPVGLFDASIEFNNVFAWDFSPLDGITAGAFDFVGVATHEIGHALGFVSGVDFLDAFEGPGLPEDDYRYVTPLDFYRYSAESAAFGVFDWTADTRSKYFSIQGGGQSLATFSTGRVYGDGRQASHWQDNLGLGLMDPTAAEGELLAIRSLDLMALDVIGFDLAAEVNVPAPLPLAAAAAAFAWSRRLRRRLQRGDAQS